MSADSSENIIRYDGTGEVFGVVTRRVDTAFETLGNVLVHGSVRKSNLVKNENDPVDNSDLIKLRQCKNGNIYAI